MKRLVLVLLAAAICAWGQQTRQMNLPTIIFLPDGAAGQLGCRVQIVDASFERPPQLMFTSKIPEKTGPRLRLRYYNDSGKYIQYISLRGWIKMKDNPYQLDSVRREFDLRISDPAVPSSHGTEVLKLVDGALGFEQVEVRQITYYDGSTWKADNNNCAFRANGGTLKVETK